jgi:glutamate N-acetyltransferase/amino-acid N-acetyltransferase
VFAAPVDFPPHERCVELEPSMSATARLAAMVLGGDLTHEYVSENADYRS